MRFSPTVLALALGLSAIPAQGRTLDRVAAIAGDHVILLSEVQLRAKPRVLEAAREEKDPLALAKRTTKELHETCELLINGLLIADEAKRVNVVVSEDEVDKAIASVATSNNLTLDQLYAAAAEQGYDAATYHAEISATILEQKLALVRAKTSDEKKIEAARKEMIAELRARVYVEDRLAE